MAITIVLVLQSMIFGSTLVEESFGDFDQPQGVLEILQEIVNAIWGVVLYIFNAITFNVGGAPWFIRVPISTYVVSIFVWTIATLIRGN